MIVYYISAILNISLKLDQTDTFCYITNSTLSQAGFANRFGTHPFNPLQCNVSSLTHFLLNSIPNRNSPTLGFVTDPDPGRKKEEQGNIFMYGELREKGFHSGASII